MVDILINWMASVNESRWHRVRREGGSPVALCAHRLRGPVRRLISFNPPKTNDGRTICPNCLNLGYELTQLVDMSTKRNQTLTYAIETIEASIAWPVIDQDQNNKKVPGSAYLPGTAANLTAAA